MKVKEYVRKNKNGIKQEALRVGYYTFGLAVGYVVGCKLTSWKIETGLMKVFKQDPNVELLMRNALNELNKS